MRTGDEYSIEYIDVIGKKKRIKWKMGNARIWEIRGKVGGKIQEKLMKQKEKNEKWLEIQDWNASMKRKKKNENKLMQELEERVAKIRREKER